MDFKTKIREKLAPLISPRLAERALQLRDYHKFSALYGNFHFDEAKDELAVVGLPTESGGIRGELVDLIRQIRPDSINTLLLPGENSQVKDAWRSLIKNDRLKVITTGMSQDADILWNFEEPTPVTIGSADLIVSQAILEHLLDPFGHVKNLWELLETGGHLIILTVIPGFHYHRYPIDCVRFFPDWFEELANRLGAKIVHRSIIAGRITYQFHKQA